MNLGLTKAEAQIYFYLTKRGPKKASEITTALKMKRQQLYLVIRRLESKAMVNTTIDRPAKFSAVPFEKVLDSIAKAKFEEAKIIEANKGNLLSDWESIALPEVEENTSKFTVIKGRNHVYSKIQQMIEETRSHFSIMSNFSGLLRAEQFGVFDTIQSHPMKSKIDFRIITQISKNHLKVMKKLASSLNARIRVKVQNIDEGLTLAPFPRFIIRDNDEILYFISQQTSYSENRDDFTGILTNYHSLVKPFSRIFEDAWRKSTFIQQQIIEIETGTSPARTLIIDEPEIASAKFNKTFENAQKNIIMITSSQEIMSYWKNPSVLKELNKTGVSIKIMAPISRENLKECLDLSEFCEVRHIPNEYMKTIIIDGKHLFQFKIPESRKKEMKSGSAKQAFYSNDFEYVENTKKMLLDIWKGAAVPSAVTAGSIIAQQLSDSQQVTIENSKDKFVDVVYTSGQFYPRAQPTKITEKDVISEIEAYKKSPKRSKKQVDRKDIVLCGTIGYAVIRSHSNFEFPDIFIIAYDIDEESTFGAEDALVISLEMKEVSGRKHYLPVAVVGDNPKASDGWKISLEGPLLFARDNYHLFEKDEIHVQSLGNTFFAGWTKPIPLLSAQKPLPPSALMLEATGKIRSESFRINVKGGLNQQHRFNYSDAFVTFIHQKTKYHGPSTDGSFLREMYLTNI
jgi:HTH-type transcriptional regulator, sugar sensing transcriptional regulator